MLALNAYYEGSVIDDPEGFDRYVRTVHLPLVAKYPRLRALKYSKGVPRDGVAPTAGSLVRDVPMVRLADLSRQKLATLLGETKEQDVYVLDDERRPLGVVNANMLKTNGTAHAGSWSDASRLKSVPCISDKSVVEEMLPLVAGDDQPIAVVDDSGRFLGSVSRESAINALARPPG